MTRYYKPPVQTTPYFKRTTKMPSLRRIKVFGVLVCLFVVTLLFWTASLRKQRTEDPRTVGDFYAKTMNALDKKPYPAAAGGSDDEEVAKAMSERLQEAAQVAKKNTNAKAPKPDPPSSVVGVGSAAEGAREERGVAGRKKFPVAEAQEPVKEESAEDHEAEIELTSILKKSPIIIFSKSYCPHSRRAKDILLGKYILEPAPFVVELDQHPMGARLQARLAELTGRKTVPNILLDGVSIGGGDDIAEYHSSKALVGKINSLVGKKMTLVKEQPAQEISHGLR